jgi:hypothetical protein
MSTPDKGSRLPISARTRPIAISWSTEPRIHKLTMFGGLLAACGGILHFAGAALMRSEIWSQIVDEGFVNTVTLDPSADRLAVAEAFWFSPGSFGVPLLLLGCLVTWLARRGQRVPGLAGMRGPGVGGAARTVGWLRRRNDDDPARRRAARGRRPPGTRQQPDRLRMTIASSTPRCLTDPTTLTRSARPHRRRP